MPGACSQPLLQDFGEVLQKLKNTFSQELQSFQNASPAGNTAGTEATSAQSTRLLEVAQPSAAVLDGLLSDPHNKATEPKDLPNVGSVLPTILVQYLAWQRLCELTTAQHKVLAVPNNAKECT